jgi:hypothetical protein
MRNGQRRHHDALNQPWHFLGEWSLRSVSSKNSLHPSFRNQRTSNITIWDGRSALEPIVILQKFLIVQNACSGKVAIVERVANQMAQIML